MNYLEIYFRMDVNEIIKVSDFGLAEDIYSQNYFHQSTSGSTKLPIKWMSIESINQGKFTDKTDVVKNVNFVHVLIYNTYYINQSVICNSYAMANEPSG